MVIQSGLHSSLIHSVNARCPCATRRQDDPSGFGKPFPIGNEPKKAIEPPVRIALGPCCELVLLTREGWDINMKRTYRIYRDLGLQLRNKTPKRRVKAKLREDRATAVGPNDVWAMDFVHDQLATGKKIRVLTVVDTFSRYVPVLDPRFSYRAEDVVRTLEQVCPEIGYPKTIRVDQGSEFISRDLDLWAYTKGITLDFSRPGKPTDNAYIEAFNGRFRAECLNAHWFLTLADAAEKMEDWRRYYNEVSARMGNRAQGSFRSHRVALHLGVQGLGVPKVKCAVPVGRM